MAEEKMYVEWLLPIFHTTIEGVWHDPSKKQVTSAWLFQYQYISQLAIEIIFFATLNSKTPCIWSNYFVETIDRAIDQPLQVNM